ncbi:MAG: hypothetical protein ABFS39_14110, partial [Pseudomonadota bacterium]
QDKSPPAGVEVVEIDPLSGLRGAGCKETQAIPFIKGHGPSRDAACARRSSRMIDEGINWLQRLFE